MSEIESYRLNKYIAMCGICSRREADRLIAAGSVTVNGQPGSTGMQVYNSDRIMVNGKEISINRQKRVVLAYYKPIGVTCTEKDKYAETVITDVLAYPVRVTYAGRLDKDSEGLLIMTNDGELIDNMMRGSRQHEKEYIVTVNKDITDAFLQQMQQGIYLDELDITTRSCTIKKLDTRTFQIVLTQGVNRQIKRMTQKLGFRVLSIKRIRVVNIKLAKLKPGEYREVTGEELHVLYNLCGLNR